MDILNFISWIKGGRQVTTVDASKTLIPVGLKDNRRDDGYLAGAITVEDLATQIAPEPTYKVYTALLTQSGGDDFQSQLSGAVQKGVTYYVDGGLVGVTDFSNVGGQFQTPETGGYYFVATIDGVPNEYGGASADYNTGAPVVTVLENTIGNIWFTYNNEGVYGINSGGLFFENKSWSINVLILQASVYSFLEWRNFNEFRIQTINGTLANDLLLNTPIEIRVYN